MSEGRAASLDGSLLAQKGAAEPAIQDDSLLVLSLDEHRPGLEGPAVVSEDNQQNDITGLAAVASNRLDGLKARLTPILPRVWLLVAGVAAVAVIAILWPAGNTENSSPVVAESTSGAVPSVETISPSLKLRLTAAPEVTETKDVSPTPLATTVALPALAALAVTEPSKHEVAAAEPAVTETPTEPASGSVVLANAPSSETAPPVAGVNPSPEIPATIPKSVSPVPLPRAKPEVSVAPAGRYAVQLASIASEKRANEEAFRLQKHLAGILSGREIMVEKAVVAGKGTRCRLRASGYRSYAEARAACTRVVQFKVNCLAVRR